MAGTRLWVQSIFVVEFFAALLLAAYMGILRDKPNDDPLSILLFPPPGRAYLENHPIKDQLWQQDDEVSNGEAPFFPRASQLNLPAGKAAVAQEENDPNAAATWSQWESALQQIKLPQDYILVYPNGGNNDDVSSVPEEPASNDSSVSLLCQNPELLQPKSSHDNIDLYICDASNAQNTDGKQSQQHQHHHPRVVVKNGTMFFYPPPLSASSLDESSAKQQHRIAALNAVYPNIMKGRQDNLSTSKQRRGGGDDDAPSLSALSSCHDSPIHFKLLVDMSTSTTDVTNTNDSNSKDWKQWMDALNLAILKRQEEQAGGLLLGHLLSPSLSFSVEIVSDLAAAATRHETTTTTTTTNPITRTSNAQIEDSDDEGAESWNKTISSTFHHHEITLADLVQSTDELLPFDHYHGASRSGRDDGGAPFNIYFYLSALPGPLLIVNNHDDDDDERLSSRTVALSDRAIFRILDSASALNAHKQDNNHNDGNGEEGLFPLLQTEATLALNEVMDFVTRSCLGIDASAALGEQQDRISAASSSTPLWETRDGSFPRFYRTLSFRRTFLEYYDKAVTAVRTQRDLVLTTTSSLVAIRDEHIAVWNDAVDHIFQAISLLDEMKREESVDDDHEIMLKALDCLQQAMRLVDDMRANPDFIDRLDFPLEQYAAIFAPLALPLAIPLLIGWIREFKRYREKQKKKRKASSSSTAAAAAQDSSKDSNEGTSIKED